MLPDFVYHIFYKQLTKRRWLIKQLSRINHLAIKKYKFTGDKPPILLQLHNGNMLSCKLLSTFAQHSSKVLKKNRFLIAIISQKSE